MSLSTFKKRLRNWVEVQRKPATIPKYFHTCSILRHWVVGQTLGFHRNRVLRNWVLRNWVLRNWVLRNWVLGQTFKKYLRNWVLVFCRAAKWLYGRAPSDKP